MHPNDYRVRVTQQGFTFRRHGGARKGAGRPCTQPRASQAHKTRPDFAPTQPLHVTLRVVQAVGNLRRRDAYHAVRYAMYCVIPRHDFRIVHISLQHDHVHLIVEANDKRALARGMQAFQISAAQRLNQAIGDRRGTVFVDRYHARVLASPTAVRHALAYVLNNWRKHREDARHTTRTLDPYSSAVNFGGWDELGESPVLFRPPPGYQRLSTCLPQTWLLQRGWSRGGSISARSVPGPQR